VLGLKIFGLTTQAAGDGWDGHGGRQCVATHLKRGVALSVRPDQPGIALLRQRVERVKSGAGRTSQSVAGLRRPRARRGLCA
jgi:hypothetical protein